MKNLAIIGSGDLGRLIAYHANNDSQHKVVGFFDDFADLGTEINDVKVIGKLSDIKTMHDNQVFDEIIMGIGYKHFDFRESLFNTLKEEITFATIVHSSCYVAPSCTIGKGACLLPGSVLDDNVTIGDNVLVNVSVTIAHDSEIKAHSFLSPRVAIAGFVSIGERCNIGINTTIIDNIVVKDNIQTGGGTVVISDLLEEGLYVGNPSRFIKR